jgi:hypothetical protein
MDYVEEWSVVGVFDMGWKGFYNGSLFIKMFIELQDSLNTVNTSIQEISIHKTYFLLKNCY